MHVYILLFLCAVLCVRMCMCVCMCVCVYVCVLYVYVYVYVCVCVYVCKSVEQYLYKGVFMCVCMRGARACLFNLTIVRRKLEDAEERLEASLLGYLIEIRHECLKVLPVEEHEPPVEVVPVHLPPPSPLRQLPS